MADTTQIPGFADALRFTNTQALGIAPGSANMNAQQQQNFLNSVSAAKNPQSQPASSGSASPQTNQYAVVTSAPATANYNAITSDYQQNIQPNLQRASATQAQGSQLPVINGYNVSANPTGNLGETKATNNATGQSYYITPQDKPATAGDIKNALSGKAPAQTSQPTAPTNSAPQTPTQTPAQQATAQTGTNPTAEATSYQGKVTEATDDLTSAYNTFKSTIQNIQSGAFPLSGAQQALVDATNSAFKQMTEQSNLKAAALSSQTGGVSNKINATAGELTNITAQQAATIAKLEIGFQEQNYKMVTDSYNAFKDLESTKLNAVQSLHKDVMDVYNSALKSASDQREYDFNVKKFETETTQKGKEFNEKKAMDAFDRAYKTEDLQIKRANSALGINETGSPVRQVVGTDSTGKPVAADQQAFISKLPPATAQMVKSLTDYSMDPKNLSARGNSRQQVLALAHQYDPTFDENNYASISKTKNDYTSGATHKTIVSLNTSINHAADLANDFKNLPNSDITKVNNIKNWYDTNVGKGNITKVVNDLNALGGELAKTYKGTAGTDAEISNIEKGINANSSPEQIKSFIESSMTLLGGRLGALQEGYTTPNGAPIPGSHSLLNPSTSAALSTFKNGGYKINVPGVLYTDPKSYVKYEPHGADNLKKVIATYPSLSQADALQLAQSLDQ